VEFAEGSVGLEGFKLDSSEKAHAERFISGEIDLDDFVKGRREPVSND